MKKIYLSLDLEILSVKEKKNAVSLPFHVPELELLCKVHRAEKHMELKLTAG